MAINSFGRSFQTRQTCLGAVPGEAVAHGALTAARNRDLGVEPGPKRVLIVDDNACVLSLTAELLDHLGYQTATAEEGIGALCQLKAAHYDILLTDFEMPGMDGYELAEAAKRHCFGIKVILMTGHCTDELAARIGASTTVDGFLSKPFDLKTVREMLKQVAYQQFSEVMA